MGSGLLPENAPTMVRLSLGLKLPDSPYLNSNVDPETTSNYSSDNLHEGLPLLPSYSI